VSDFDALLPSLRLLAKTAAAIPFGDLGFVAAGGVVPFIYRLRDRAYEPPTPVLRTLDSDVVAPRQLRRPWPRPAIPARLLEHGLARVETPGYRRERGAEYYQDASFGTVRLAREYVEFLTWKRGKDGAFADLAGGIRVQTLRYLDLLTFEPLTFDLVEIAALALQKRTEVLLPQPAMFIIQKALSRAGRAPAKQPKDLAYIYDVVVTTHAEVSEARDVIARAIKHRHDWHRWIGRALRNLELLFASADAVGPHEVRSVFHGLMPSESIPGPRAISTVVLDWVAEVRAK
jgi:hypothetical protein